jgi:hypothetical protein
LSSVSSSWLRTKFAHPQSSGIGGRRLKRRAHGGRVAARERQVHGLVHDEAEDHVQLVAVLVAEERALLLRCEVDLAHQDRVAAPAPHEAAQVAEEGVRIVAARPSASRSAR